MLEGSAPLDLKMAKFETSAPSSMKGYEAGEGEEVDEGLESCRARGGRIETGPDGRRVCVIDKSGLKTGKKVGNTVSGLLAEDPTAAPSGILGVFRKILGM